jgi:hypothetical protein
MSYTAKKGNTNTSVNPDATYFLPPTIPLGIYVRAKEALKVVFEEIRAQGI